MKWLKLRSNYFRKHIYFEYLKKGVLALFESANLCIALHYDCRRAIWEVHLHRIYDTLNQANEPHCRNCLANSFSLTARTGRAAIFLVMTL
jgi:hypothetical protein